MSGNTPTSYRAASLADAALLSGLGRQFFAESRFSNFVEYDQQATRGFIEQMIANGVVLLALRGLDVVGFLGGCISGPWFAPRARIATEYAWWVHPEVRGTPIALRLLREFEAWAKGQGADLVNLTSLALIDSPATNILLRQGYDLVEQAHVKRL